MPDWKKILKSWGCSLVYEAPTESIYHTTCVQPAERVVLGRAARNSALAPQAVGVSPSASRIPMVVPAALAGGEASARKVCTSSPPMGVSVLDPSL